MFVNVDMKAIFQGLFKKYCLRQQILRSHMFVNLLKTFTVNEKDIDRFKG